MKELPFVLLIATFSLAANAQGTVEFSNVSLAGGGVNAPVYQSDGVTLCSGPQFMAELLAGPSVNSLASIATTGFLTGLQAGYFFGGYQTINSVSGGNTAWIQVDVWNTSSGASTEPPPCIERNRRYCEPLVGR